MKLPINDTVATQPTGSLIEGTEGPDQLDDLSHNGSGGASDPGSGDTIRALGGNDTIQIHNGDDRVDGGAGDDKIYDYGTGNDVMKGGAGENFFLIGEGNDTVDGSGGMDRVSYADSQQLAAVDLESGQAISEGTDTLISVEHAIGSDGNDSLLGSATWNFLVGGDGNDRIDGRGGVDTLWGDAGSDTLAGGTDDDHLYGGNGNDSLDGGTGTDVLEGEAGKDTLKGGDGSDLLWGGGNDDTMTGGAGGDRFFFVQDDIQNYDVITDFQHGVDKIDVKALDARPDQAGFQAYHFDSTPDGKAEELIDGLSDDWNGLISSAPGPTINGDPGEIEVRHSGGNTYVYLSEGDGPNDVSILLHGDVNLTASDFILTP